MSVFPQNPVAHMRLMCGSCRCCAGGPHCALALSFPKLLASISLHNSLRSFLRSSFSLSRSTQNTPSLLAPCFLPLASILRPGFREDAPPSRVQWEACCCHQPVKETASSKWPIQKARSKRGTGSCKKTPADPEHLTTSNSAPLTPTSMLMGLVEST